MTQARLVLEQELSDRTRELHRALDAARAGTWRIDVRARQIAWGERSRAMLGVVAGPQPLEEMWRRVHPDDRPRLQQRYYGLERSAETRLDETFRVVRDDGRTVWLHAVGEVIRGDDGHLDTLTGISLDVTEAKRAEQALKESLRHEQEATESFVSLMAATSEGILTHDKDGVITHANAALHAMFGYGAGELIGQPVERLVPDAARSVHRRERSSFWERKESRRMGQGLDLVGQRKDGSTFPVEVSLSHVAMPPPNGRVFAFVVDITGRKRAENDLRRSHDQLQRRTEQLRRLTLDLTLAEQEAREGLAKTLHDGLQQMLFSVKLRLDLMAEGRSTTADRSVDLAKVRQDLDEAITAARSLAIELFPPPLHEGSLAAATAWLAAWMHKKFGLTVEVTTDPRATLDAPAQRSRRTLVFESLRELLFDVVKHAKVTRAAVDLAWLPDDQLRITVADEGIGFDPAMVLAQPATSGWGLFAIRERAEALGGSLQMESAKGRGTRFLLTIPRGETGEPRQALRLLIADDHVIARAGLREILTNRPEFEIVGEVATGADAVAQAKALRPDAIVMDVSMPEMNGVEATRRILAALPTTQIFGMSTQERPDGLHAIEEAGAVGYFSKGDGAQQLIERLLALHRERQASKAPSVEARGDLPIPPVG